LTPTPRTAYRVGIPLDLSWRVLLNSDDADFGGSGYRIDNDQSEPPMSRPFTQQSIAWQGQSHSIEINLPPLSVLYLVPVHDNARCMA
ncbi:MAG: alpha amylase C-terminal domain-containing protein, partial [Betaproteobacteria bacterium]